MHHKLLKQELVNEIFNDPSNFNETDGLVKDSVLTSYGIRCPNMCSEKGSCEKSYKIEKEIDLEHLV